MVDKQAIMNTLQQRYVIPKDTYVDIQEDGTVDIEGSISMGHGWGDLGLQFGTVTEDFDISSCDLSSLKGCPERVEGDFDASTNNLTTLLHGPRYVGGSYNVIRNHLVDLNGLADHIGGMLMFTWSPQLGVLRSLVSSNIWVHEGLEVQKIVNDPKWAGKGKKGSLMCAAALIKAGFEGNAKW